MLSVWKYSIEERQEDIDVERIPDAVPRGDFKPIPPLSDPITMIALDLETTDVICAGQMPHITQIAAKVVNSGIGQTFCVYVQPKMPISTGAQQATGITVNGDIMTVNGTVVDTVDINCALDCLIQWLDKYSNVIVTAHNGRRFDFPVLISALCNTNKIDRFFKCAQGLMDTLTLFRKTFPGRPSYKQEDLARDILQYTYNAHNAEDDVTALCKILSHSCSLISVQDLMKFTFSPRAVYFNFLSSKEKAKNLCTLQGIVACGICKLATAENIASSGLNLNSLKKIYLRQGEDGLHNTFTCKNSEGQPRVTNTKRVLESVIPKLVEHFKK